MNETLNTPRLKLTLVTKAVRDSEEFKWIHELRSDEKATWWRYLPFSFILSVYVTAWCSSAANGSVGIH